MTACYSHTPAEVERLEARTGLRLLCYLDPGDGGPLLPVLGKPGQHLGDRERKSIALRLSGRGAIVDLGQVERAG